MDLIPFWNYSTMSKLIITIWKIGATWESRNDFEISPTMLKGMKFPLGCEPPFPFGRAQGRGKMRPQLMLNSLNPLVSVEIVHSTNIWRRNPTYKNHKSSLFEMWCYRHHEGCKWRESNATNNHNIKNKSVN